MLSGLTILLGSTARASMMAGLYVLLLPLKSWGLAPERFAARLWLTLHYVETAPRDSGGSRWERLRHWDIQTDERMNEMSSVTLSIPPLRWRDGVIGLAFMVGLALAVI
jgi:energy-coupling factor transport system permease protein